MARLHLLSVASLLAASASAGCSSPADDSEPPLQTIPGDAGAGGAGGAADASGPKPMHASFVAETEVGKSPAVLRFFNDTPETLSYYLGPVEYWLIGPYATSEPKVVASASMLGDSQLLYHTKENLCYQIKIDSIAGPSALSGATGYTLHVTKTPDKQIYQLEVFEDAQAPPPFIAIRAHLPTPSSLNGIAALDIGFAGRGKPRVSFDVFGVLPSPYAVLDAGELDIARLDFVDRSKKAYVFDGSVPLSAATASGFTIVLDVSPVAGADVVVLDPVP